MSRASYKEYRKLAKQYGVGFANKVYIYTIGASLLAVIIMVVGILLYRTYDENSEFILDNANKYIITEEISKEYYEVDIDKEKIVRRKDEERHREKISKIKYNKELVSFINKIKRNNNNKSITSEEISNLLKSGIYYRYNIKDYNGYIYYIKTKEDTIKLKEILRNT